MVGGAINFEMDQNWICPDLREHWQLARRHSDCVILRSRQTKQQWEFSDLEGNVLRYFTGQFTVNHVQQVCQQKACVVSPTLVSELIGTDDSADRR